MKRSLLLTAALLLAIPVHAAGPLPWHKELEPALAEAAKTDRLVFVDLFADWCGWCRVLDQKVFSTEPFAEYAAERFVLVRLDVEDGAEGSRTQTRYDASQLPTVLILTPEEALVGKVQGMAPTDRYLRKLEAEITGYRRLVELYEQLTADAQPAQLRALAEHFHRRLDGERAARLYRRLAEKGWQELDGAGWLSYRLADALRLAGEHDQAAAAAAEARKAGGDDGELIEAVDLLSISIATDRGDCDRQRQALKSFLRDHPQSSHRTQVESALSALERGEPAMRCS